MHDVSHFIITALTVDLRRVYKAEGKVLASTPLTSWLNTRAIICLFEWRCSGMTGYAGLEVIEEIESCLFICWVPSIERI